jgi:aspartyl-tRNA(Asn)/glutamyl-tRNA(Gln) amidotransferase subunit A
MSRRVERMRARIREHAALNAFICETAETGDGTVVAVKDLIDVRDTPTTAGSTVLDPTPARADAPVIGQLRSAGCLVIGKTNLHEWALGPTSANRHFGPVRNPSDRSRFAGGSSGGSAVAVALRMCDWAVGTDTGGSIRIPAGLCGVVGFKPTFGSIDMRGVVPVSQSLDTIGPLAPSVTAALRAHEMLTGQRQDYSEPPGWTDLRIGIPRGWVSGLDDATAAAWAVVSDNIREIEFPPREVFASAILPIMQGEAGANHRKRFAQHRESYGADVLAFIEAGLNITAAAYLEAKREQSRLTDDFELAMLDFDAILLPTTASVAPRLDEGDAARDALTRFTRPTNLTGHPVFSVPLPGAHPLPIGIQVVGHHSGDRALGRVALALERHLGATAPN